MCGIAGIVELDRGATAEQRRVEAMMRAIRHRGPDDSGTHFDGPVGLGHQRLSIIDLEGGHQPMSNEDGSIWIVFNGEIYNHVELRAGLEREHVFKTRSDTEVILHLYEDLGERCLERLNGMFSFVIWDSRRQRLFAARDRMGIKPFYWTIRDGRYLFASEPKAIFASGLVTPEPDEQSLQQYLTFQFCLGDRTLFKDVRRLEPGHYMLFRPHDDVHPTIARYWEVSYELDTHHTETYFVDELRWLLKDAVRLQLRSDVPVGAHLSGGIDSSTVVSLGASQYSGSFHSFTGGFREGPQFDETHYARAVAEQACTTHHEVWPTWEDFRDSVPRLIYMMDEPAAGPGLFPQYMVSKLARENVKVVLGGQGGDEIFGGYARYLIAYLEQCLKGAIYGTQDPRHVVTWDNISPNLPLLRQYQPLMQKFWGQGLFDDMDARYYRLIQRLDDSDEVVADGVCDAPSRERLFCEFQSVFNNAGTKSYFNKMTNFDMKTLLPALLQVEDRTSMAVSLESRVPLLDHRIVELVARMAPAVRFKGGDTKRVFRDAVQPLLPEVVYNRQDKMGFPVPIGQWFRGPLRDFLGDILLSDRARQRGLYRMDGIERMIIREQRFGRQIWGLLCLELWYRAFIDGDELRDVVV
jgi:asparagine synthase (glutamine-hydrolysing)